MADAYERFFVNPDEYRELYSLMIEMREQCAEIAQRSGNPDWLNVGREIADIMSSFSAELDAIAKQAAVTFDMEAEDLLRSKIVRPPTGNRPGLTDVIESVAVPMGGVSAARVELGLVAKLNTAINDGASSAKPYWKAQEFGSSKMVGRGIQGMFFGGAGEAVPNALLFRMHPLFFPGAGGKGVINRAIPAKHFLRDAAALTLVQWRGELRTAVARAAQQLNSLTLPAVAKPPVR